MTVLEYLQSLDSETRVAVVGYTDNVLQGIRSLDAKTAAAASFADCFSAICAAKSTVAFTVLVLFLLPLGRGIGDTSNVF